MKKLFAITVALFMLCMASVAAERFVDFRVLEGVITVNGSLQTTNVPVNNVNAYGYICEDSSCSSPSGQLNNGNSISSGNDNIIRINYPTQLQSPWGYAHVFYKPDFSYIPWAQRANFSGTTSQDPQGPYNIYLTKMQSCFAPIDQFVVVNDARPHEPVMFEVSASLDANVWSAIEFGGPIGFQAPQIPDQYEVQTQVVLTIRDQNNNIVHTETRMMSIPFSGVERVMFSWTPQVIGRFSASVTTTVPDAKCLEDVPQSSTKNFSVIGDNTNLCYSLANGLNVQPIFARAGEQVVIGLETVSNYYDDIGALHVLPTQLRYDITRGTQTTTFTRTVAAASQPQQYQVVAIPYSFPVEGNYDVTVTATPLNCPYTDRTYDVVSQDYVVLPGQPNTTNTPPVLNAPNVYLNRSRTVTVFNDIMHLPDYAIDPDQNVNTLRYEITQQSNTNVAQCSIDANKNLDCTVSASTYGDSTVYFRVTDNNNAFGIDTVVISVPRLFQCDDGIDNDGDGFIDLADIGCEHIQDDNEADDPIAPECRDGIDNDHDTLIDFPADPGCSNPDDNSEHSATTQCQDGLDNDGDGLYDFPADPGCANILDNNEQGAFSCSDTDSGNTPFTRGTLSLREEQTVLFMGTDSCVDANTLREFVCTNAGFQDGYPVNVDVLVNCAYGCANGACNQAPPTPQCSDNVDNDGDGLVDMSDPGCSSPSDNDESNGTAQCQDGIDNDGDGFIDFPADPGCSSRSDNTEQGVLTCQDTDNGNMPFTRGILSIREESTILFQGTDVCVDSNTLREFVCTNAGFSNGAPTNVDVLVSCAYGCDAGRCLEQTAAPECRDGIDNDNDGYTDFPADLGCSSPDDDSEFGETNPNAPTQVCADGIDNDGDGLIDWPQDPGCYSSADNDETDVDDDENNLIISRIRIINPELLAEGQDGLVSFTLENDGDDDLKGLRVQVMIPEIGVRGSIGPFTLDEGESLTRSVYLPVYEPLAPGEYMIRISARSDEVLKVKHMPLIVE